MSERKPFKIKNVNRSIRKDIFAGSLEELRKMAAEKFEKPGMLPTIHLDSDGTEVDDEEYYRTLEANAELIAVFPGEQWIDPTQYVSISSNSDTTDAAAETERIDRIVDQLQDDLCNGSAINEQDLESLSNMDPNSLVDITGKDFMEQFQDTGIESINKDSAEFSKVIWREKALKLHVNEVTFHGSTLLPEDIKELSTPSQLFLYFFTKEIIEVIVQETNRCALSQDINSKFSVNVEDICHYIGVHLYMSIYRYPNLESYWGKNAFNPICNTMPLKRFEAIKRYLCFRDEGERVKKGQAGYDPLFRIRNFMNLLNERFDSIPKHARLWPLFAKRTAEDRISLLKLLKDGAIFCSERYPEEAENIEFELNREMNGNSTPTTPTRTDNRTYTTTKTIEVVEMTAAETIMATTTATVAVVEREGAAAATTTTTTTTTTRTTNDI